ncbi:hypothetical protein FRC17_000739 [Serendipita sp. 399]|nr:hypothetical protein FRC17_000739 [Serendipita sp. 399]
MSFRHPGVIAATVGVVVLTPVVLLNVMPLFRTLRPPQKPLKLPQGVKRTTTPNGLELWVALPPDSESNDRISTGKAPLLLVHGGFGTAHCYAKWLPYLASRGRIVYSVSLTGHGQSPRPSNFVKMTVSDYAPDLEQTINYIHTQHSELPKPVVLGHSAGGGLAQYILANRHTPISPPPSSSNNHNSHNSEPLVSGAIFMAAFPPFGGWTVYMNWFRFDPTLGFRAILCGGDPKAALSSLSLVRNAFFGPRMREEELERFYAGMNPEESVGWPQTMMLRFIRDVEKVKQGASGRVAWIGGEKDALMTQDIVRRAAKEYDAPLIIVKDAGHHLPWDEVWQDAADAVIAQLDSWSL